MDAKYIYDIYELVDKILKDNSITKINGDLCHTYNEYNDFFNEDLEHIKYGFFVYKNTITNIIQNKQVICFFNYLAEKNWGMVIDKKSYYDFKQSNESIYCYNYIISSIFKHIPENTSTNTQLKYCMLLNKSNFILLCNFIIKLNNDKLLGHCNELAEHSIESTQLKLFIDNLNKITLLDNFWTYIETPIILPNFSESSNILYLDYDRFQSFLNYHLNNDTLYVILNSSNVLSILITVLQHRQKQYNIPLSELKNIKILDIVKDDYEFEKCLYLLSNQSLN